MPEISLNLSEALRKQFAAALRSVSVQIRWKPGKAQPHLEKRIRLAHLPPMTSLADYEAVVNFVLQHSAANVYVFQYGDLFYPTVVAPYQGRVWLVMFGMNGVMETAFPPDDPVTYFLDPKYSLLGPIQEFYDE